MAPKKMAATMKVHKWHGRNVYEPYQALSSASMSNGTVNSAGEYIAEVPDRRVTTTGESSTF